ncbi:hypothetical protein [Nocardia sp. IFM 10818]
MSVDLHRRNAGRALGRIPGAETGVDSLAFTSEATAHALLALVEHVGALVAELRTANLIAAYGADALDGRVNYAALENAIHARLDDIARIPEPVSDNEGTDQ